MAANVEPIYTKTPHIEWISYIVTANTTADLTAGTSYLTFTATTNGSFLSRLRFRPTPAGNTTATVARIWINNGATTGTAANNILFDEITLPAITASSTAATAGYDVPVNFPLPNGYRVYVTIHTGSANGWACSSIGGDY